MSLHRGAENLPPEISVVIPVYNGARSIAAVVERVRQTFAQQQLQIVLVNDGSRDNSEEVCLELQSRYPQQIEFVQLARNFGEHNAVMCGLNHTCGEYVAIMDDDAQNPPEELPRMLEYLQTHRLDVVYGRYQHRKHSWWRQLGSRFNDRMANWMLRKPPELYLSSFKVMHCFVVREIIRYHGPFPYIDGLIFQATSRLGQIDVKHDKRLAGHSGYTLRKLVGLWLNMFLGFSILPLRLTILLGFFACIVGVLALFGIIIDKIWLNPNVTVGIPTVIASIILFAGVQLIVLGTIGEYVGRVFLHTGGRPIFVERYAKPINKTDS
jgi:glycosyltransferase involved in cell wall biosynthesis